MDLEMKIRIAIVVIAVVSIGALYFLRDSNYAFCKKYREKRFLMISIKIICTVAVLGAASILLREIYLKRDRIENLIASSEKTESTDSTAEKPDSIEKGKEIKNPIASSEKIKLDDSTRKIFESILEDNIRLKKNLQLAFSENIGDLKAVILENGKIIKSFENDFIILEKEEKKVKDTFVLGKIAHLKKNIKETLPALYALDTTLNRKVELLSKEKTAK